MLIIEKGGPAVEVSDLVKGYRGGRAPAVAGISFTIGRGEIFGLLGPNGSGKTTTVRILVTLLRQTAGTALVGGFDTFREAPRVRRLIGYAGQFTGVDDDLTVRENLAYAAMLQRIPHNESWRRADALIGEFALAEVEGQRASRLSGGLRRRLDLARALIHRPAVLFLDEPTTGLDPQSRGALWDRLRALAAGGTSVLLTTQYLEEADRACDRIAILDAGRIVVSGTPVDLKEATGGGHLLLTTPDSSRAALLLAGFPGVTSVRPGDRLAVFCRDPAASLVPVIQLLGSEGIVITAAELAQPTLDDVFLRYTGSRPRAEAPVTGAVSGTFAAGHGRRRAS
jgi:ABC-type multidrug transport system ATPase subunit